MQTKCAFMYSATASSSKVTGMTYENGLATLQMANGDTTLAGLIEEIR